MSEESPQRGILNTLEWHPVAPKERFYDNVERRFFQNATPETLIIGFGHDTRRLEIIAIAFEKDAVKAEDPALKKYIGEEIIEDET